MTIIDCQSTQVIQLFQAIFVSPLASRIKRGEGGHIILCSLIIFLEGDASLANTGTKVIQVLFAALLCLSLYAFNDIADRSADVANPKKFSGPSIWYTHHQTLAYGAWFLFTLSLGALIKWTPPLYSLNLGAFFAAHVSCAVYSWVLKRFPVADLISVGACGAAVLAVFSPKIDLVLAVGIMTAIAHIYQTREDLAHDFNASVRTNASLSEFNQRLEILVLVLSLIALGFVAGDPESAIPAVVIIPIYLWLPNRGAWIASRVLFLAMFVLLLR